MTALLLVTLFFAAFPALLYFRNVRLFVREAQPGTESALSISVLIPARDEALGIAACVESVLANVGVEFEVIVLDDHSTDNTVAIVRTIAERDSRVRLESAPPLPDGWSGKQHACYSLSLLARYPIITFLDADVRLAPNGLLCMSAFLQSSKASLVSGFPRQETGTLLEKLTVPLINWLLLCYLPISQMRSSKQVGLGAGCGQWFMTTADAYAKTGGHSNLLVRSSFHDGLKLPRAYRKCGEMTDLCDATDLAVCRMYRTAGQVWNGFAKNAREGLAAPKLILVWTTLLIAGHLMPFVLLALLPEMEPWQIAVSFLAVAFTYLPRFDAAFRYRQSWFGAILHPLGVLGLLSIQWYATFRAIIGRPVGWKGRTL